MPLSIAGPGRSGTTSETPKIQKLLQGKTPYSMRNVYGHILCMYDQSKDIYSFGRKAKIKKIYC